MTTTSPHRLPRRRTELYRLAALCGTLGCALAWGLVELLALQRSRLVGWRARQHAHAPRLHR